MQGKYYEIYLRKNRKQTNKQNITKEKKDFFFYKNKQTNKQEYNVRQPETTSNTKVQR